jgi:hypothetical protein
MRRGPGWRLEAELEILVAASDRQKLQVQIFVRAVDGVRQPMTWSSYWTGVFRESGCSRSGRRGPAVAVRVIPSWTVPRESEIAAALEGRVARGGEGGQRRGGTRQGEKIAVVFCQRPRRQRAGDGSPEAARTDLAHVLEAKKPLPGHRMEARTGRSRADGGRAVRRRRPLFVPRRWDTLSLSRW